MKTQLLLALVVIQMLLTGCELRETSYEACRTPRQLSVEDLSGKWTASYAEYYVYDPLPGTVVMSDTQAYLIAPSSTPFSLADCAIMGLELDEYWTSCTLLGNSPGYVMGGIETLQLSPSGVYSQTFNATVYQAHEKWDLVQGLPDAPKLRMNGMRFFAAGTEFAKGKHPIYLEPQFPDWVKNNEARYDNPPADKPVLYPKDGFVYLYPRYCAGELVLQQMVFGFQEPDNADITGPVFKRQKMSP